jgi:hypothetical protein
MPGVTGVSHSAGLLLYGSAERRYIGGVVPNNLRNEDEHDIAVFLYALEELDWALKISRVRIRRLPTMQ